MIDGVPSPIEEARVSVLDRGFLYGDSVFETIRTYGGRPFALEEHLSRLERSAALVFIPVPVSRDVLRAEIESAILAAANPESYVRVMLTRGSGELGLDPSLAVAPLRVILVTELHPPPSVAYTEGITAVTFALRRAADSTAAGGAKVGNYLTSVLAMKEAKARGAGEALVVDADGRLVEGATSNVFFVQDGRLVTPPLDVGILPGITRARILEAAEALSIAVQYRAPAVAELPAFEEVFISSSIREMLPVVQIDGRDVGTGRPGKTYERLLGKFRERVG